VGNKEKEVGNEGLKEREGRKRGIRMMKERR
jgi:hypothetical protein